MEADLQDLINYEQLRCLTEAIYHEARGESYGGQLLVGFVIRNRVESDKFPDDFCQVIEQPWQFSFVHELDSTQMKNKESALFSERVSYAILNSRNPLPENVYYYHTTNIKPDWNWSLLEEYQIAGNHVFYEEIR